MVVLCVDDDPDDRDIFSEALNEVDSSIMCITAKNGQEALDILEDFNLPDYIFIDINMPIMGGKELLKEIKNDGNYSHIPLIMYSTSHNEDEIKEFKKLGASNYLVKPSDFITLCRSLRSILTLEEL